MVSNTFGDIVYNVGCVSVSKCNNTSFTHHGSSTEGCRECCQVDLCNAQGCGEPGYPTNRGPVCFSCPMQTNPDTCHGISVCDPGDVCKYDVLKEFGDTVYTSGCSSAHECKHDYKHGTAIVGRDVTNIKEVLYRRSFTEHVCSGCCDKDLCNKGCNGTTLVTETDYCQSSPCMHGSCVTNTTHYKCICGSSFTGERCETAVIIATDCYDIFTKNIGNTSGVYSVMLWRSKQMIDVYCDMDTPPYGWTVFQKRLNGSVDFYRNFSEYTNGFGNVRGEYWLGLSIMEEMASQYESELRLDITAADNSHVYEVFQNFSLSKYPNFTVHLGSQTVEQISGNGYGFLYCDGHDFSTFDHDVDTSFQNCGKDYHGGWWYWACAQTNLNGEYLSPPGATSTYYHGWGGLIYYAWRNIATLKSSQIMFRKHA